MLLETNQLKLYSLSEVATAMCIGRDTLRSLLAEGKIGYILVGRSKRIAHQELIRFQEESTIRKIEPITSTSISHQDIHKIFKHKRQTEKPSFDSKQLLKKIIRNNNNGHSKKTRKDLAHSVV